MQETLDAHEERMVKLEQKLQTFEHKFNESEDKPRCRMSVVNNNSAKTDDNGARRNALGPRLGIIKGFTPRGWSILDKLRKEEIGSVQEMLLSILEPNMRQKLIRIPEFVLNHNVSLRGGRTLHPHPRGRSRPAIATEEVHDQGPRLQGDGGDAPNSTPGMREVLQGVRHVHNYARRGQGLRAFHKRLGAVPPPHLGPRGARRNR